MEKTVSLGSGFLVLATEESQKLYESLSMQGLLFDQLSVLFNDYAMNKGKELATRQDISEVISVIRNLENRVIASINSGNNTFNSGDTIARTTTADNGFGFTFPSQETVDTKSAEPVSRTIGAGGRKPLSNLNKILKKNSEFSK